MNLFASAVKNKRKLAPVVRRAVAVEGAVLHIEVVFLVRQVLVVASVAVVAIASVPLLVVGGGFQLHVDVLAFRDPYWRLTDAPYIKRPPLLLLIAFVDFEIDFKSTPSI